MRNASKFFYVWLLLAAIMVLPSCNTEKIIEQPNIVWITSEDNSKHFLKLFDEHGASAPSIEFLASNGIQFNNAFSNAPVCSVARSTLISSCYTPRIGAQYHRKHKQVPMPEGLRMFPAYLRDAGYYTSNNSKEDYNIIKTDDVWDESSKKASWRKRSEGQAFFHVQNYATTHEGRLHFTKEKMQNQKTKTNPDEVFIPPVHPDTELFRYTYATYHDRIKQMDNQVGSLIEELRKDSLLENTIIFYFGDHGGVLPGTKGYIKETGLEVPLVVYVPEKYQDLVGFNQGSQVDGFVSFVDFGATVLNLAGVDIPEAIDGKPFLGKDVSVKEVESRNETYSYADRFDEKYDLVRAVRVGKYKYIRNYQPFNIDGLQNNYRYRMLAYQEWRTLFKNGSLNAAQSSFFEPKAVEELYDIDADPYETKNLAGDPEYVETLKELRTNLRERVKGLPDLSFFPEHYFLANGLENPVQFGQDNKLKIEKLVDIADLSLLSFVEAQAEIEISLKSEDSNERYWGLISCSTFGEEAKEFSSLVAEIALSDSELINRVRAAEYLALIEVADPEKVMTNALDSSTDIVETWLILNSVALLKDLQSPYAFSIDEGIFSDAFLEDRNVIERLVYINE